MSESHVHCWHANQSHPDPSCCLCDSSGCTHRGDTMTENRDYGSSDNPLTREEAQVGQVHGGPGTPLDDLRLIMASLGLPGHARPYSGHQVVLQDILPAITDLHRRVQRAERRAVEQRG